GFLYLLAGARAESEFFLVVAVDRLAHRSRISLQIHQRARAGFDSSYPQPHPQIEARVSVDRPLFFALRLCALHHPAGSLEFRARVDHPDPPEIARQSRYHARISSARVSLVSGRTLSDLLAAHLFWARLGNDRELAPSPAEFQSALPAVVWAPGIF